MGRAPADDQGDGDDGDDDDDNSGGKDKPSSRKDASTGSKRDGGTDTGGNGDKSTDQPPVDPGGIGGAVFGLCETGKESPGPRLLRLLTRREFKNTVRELLYANDQDVQSIELPLEPRVRGFDNNARSSVVTSRHLDEYLAAADKLVAKAVQEKKGQLVQGCQQMDANCGRMFVQKFGLRAFRRPLSNDEVDRYAKLFDGNLTGNNFDEGLKLAMTSMLVSPNFLYRSEAGEKQSNGTYKLTPYEVASALSYLYWGSMPDQNLFDAASKNQLGSKSEIEAQARRLLNDQKAKEQVAEFSLQWLRSDSLMSAFKDSMIYPMFQDSVRQAMIEEQKRFFIDVALTTEGTFQDLYTADYVFANGDLARFYGLPQGGNDFQKVSVTEESQRGGIVGLGAVLAAHAHSNESSPIKRGVFVRDRLLCQDLTPPPPSLDTTPPGLDPKLTTRERFARHTADTKCFGCHKYIDDVGFGLEGFDGVGQKRTMENGKTIDTSGAVLGLNDMADDTKEPFKGPRELGALLAESESAQQCMMLQFYRFARGYQEQESDACSLNQVQKHFTSKNLTIKELLVSIALLESFTVRGE